MQTRPNTTRGRTMMFYDSPPARRERDEETETIHVPTGWHGQDTGQMHRNDNPDTTSLGGGSPPGMMQKLVVAFPLEGKFAYWPQTTPDGIVIYRRDMQSKSDPERVGGPYVADLGGYLWFDVTTTMWRLWQASNQQAILSDDMSSLRAGRARSADGALGVSSRTWEQGGKNDDRGEGGEEVSGVGAQSWVGSRKNTTGYVISAADRARRLKARRIGDAQDPPLQSEMDRISARMMGGKQTGDAARPGLVQGINSAKLVAKRVSALEQINSMNARAWARG